MYQKLSLILCTLALTAVVHAQDPPENILQNGDFEDGIKQPWSMWVEDANAGVIGILDISKDEAIKGKRSLFIEIANKGNNNKRVELHQNPLFLEADETYTVSIWIKAEDVLLAKLTVNHRAAPWTLYSRTDITITEEWQEFSATFDMDVVDNIAGFYVELRDTQETTIWFDNARMYLGEYVPDPDLDGGGNLAVDPAEKLGTTWARLKEAAN